MKRYEAEVNRASGSRKQRLRVIFTGGLVLLVSFGVAAPQFTNPNNPYLNGNAPELDRTHSPDEAPYVAREMQERQLKRLREEHQKQMFSDTAELVKLAKDLKTEVDKSDTPTPDALKDVDEIGKLARRVSERIKTQ